MIVFKEIMACADGGPEPHWGMNPATAFYVSIYDDAGTILDAFFDTEAEAQVVFDRLPFPVEGTAS